MKGMKELVNYLGKKQPFVPWSHDEINRVLEVANFEGEGMMYKFVLSTGLRLGELLALSWSDIDFDKQTVTISKNVIPSGKSIEVIRSGPRTIMLSPYLISELQHFREQQQVVKGNLEGTETNKMKLVFPKKDGGIQSPYTVRVKFNRLIEKASVKRLTFHDLRKMHVVLLFNIMQHQLGHKDLESTRKRFIYFNPNVD